MLHSHAFEIAPGVRLWSGALDASEQGLLVNDVLQRAQDAPFYRPQMPRSGKPFSVEETNFGSMGWYSDMSGYRYEARHPLTQQAWETTGYPAPPECCLVNLYRAGARMGLHQDRDEAALDAPVLSVSLGDDALFRIGGTTRKAPTKSTKLCSGDVLVFGGPARLAFHGIDRLVSGSSRHVPGGGRINLTLRRVAVPRE